MITIDPHLLTINFERTRNPNTLVTINIEGGKSATCLVKEVQRHPVSGVIRHVDFYQVVEDESIEVSVPVRAVGRAIGVSMGGSLRIIRRQLVIRCKPADIPATIDVDVTELDIGKFITVDKIVSPANAELIFDRKGIFNVLTVIKQRGIE